MLTPDQQAALDAALAFLRSKDDFFVISGYAGTGKTYSCVELVKTSGLRFAITAPTNKATKVLRRTFDELYPRNDVPARTIYSLLGLRLEPNGEIKELRGNEEVVDLSSFDAILVDEGSMINAELFEIICSCQRLSRVKFIFMGDPAQLPPVKESHSPIWDLPNRVTLTQVVRYDNSILRLATELRDVVDLPNPNVRIASSDDSCIMRVSASAMYDMIFDVAQSGGFHHPTNYKAIAWRNVTVDALNSLIRRAHYGADALDKWLPTDRIVFTEPAKNSNDEIIATVDDEGEITTVVAGPHPLVDTLMVYNIGIRLDDGRTVSAKVLHPDSATDYTERLELLAQQARRDKRQWYKFWEFKELFHSIRHAYAITTHRSQGSTYSKVFVDRLDILRNMNRQEAYRCLYVACTRAKHQVILT